MFHLCYPVAYVLSKKCASVCTWYTRIHVYREKEECMLYFTINIIIPYLFIYTSLCVNYTRRQPSTLDPIFTLEY